MGKARQEQMDRIQRDIQAINLAGGFEKKRAEALWSQWEKLDADEKKEQVAK